VKEIREIVRQFIQAKINGKKTALATVVHLDGSSYRRPGARMLIEDDGQLTGAISGGCLEGDALRKALHVIAENRAMLVTYDTMDDDDAKFGVGLGCNGIIQVLIEPINYKAPHNPMVLLQALLEKRDPAVLLTLFDLNDRKAKQHGTCLVYKNAQNRLGQIPMDSDKIEKDILQVLHQKTSVFKEYPNDQSNSTAFIEYIDLPVSLVVIGAGNDVIPLIEMAKILGWDPHVVDGRANYATADRFASACSVLVSKPEKVLEQIQVDYKTVFVLMTHNYNYDLAMLRALLFVDTPYIGSLGPRKKLDRMLDELREEGLNITTVQLSKIYGPVGLHLGAETPEEIALSIIAEIQAVLKGANGGSLRQSSEFIHSRDDLKIIRS